MNVHAIEINTICAQRQAFSAPFTGGLQSAALFVSFHLCHSQQKLSGTQFASAVAVQQMNGGGKTVDRFLKIADLGKR